MPKILKPPRVTPPKASKATPIPPARPPPSRSPRSIQPRTEISSTDRLRHYLANRPRGVLSKIWDERPRTSDVRLLTPEEKITAEHVQKIGRWRLWPFFLGGLTAFGMGVYGVQLYLSLARTPQVRDVPEDLSDRFDNEAQGYDEKVNTAETLLLLNYRRKHLTKKVRGHVLEVAVGTGRNIPYYPTKKCATVTLLDSSAPMLAVAKRKWKDTHTEYFSRVYFKQQSALNPITPPFGAQSGYDTVLQTMGLCSTPEPVKLLQSLESVTKQDGGRILLMEHGKSHYDWLNELLDKTAPSHALEHGCFWNKDIGKIVEESGLEVVAMQRYNFGTTWEVELKPRPGMGRKAVPKDGDITLTEAQTTDANVEPRWWWWGSWRK